MDITLLKQKGQHLADSFLNENLALSTRLADRRVWRYLGISMKSSHYIAPN